jgi:hypothetical protein
MEKIFHKAPATFTKWQEKLSGFQVRQERIPNESAQRRTENQPSHFEPNK